MSANFDNGLNGFSFHQAEDKNNVIKDINSSFKSKARRMAVGTIPKPEDVAKFYLEKAFESQTESLETFNKPESFEGSKIAFESFQSEHSPFTENRTIKFRQKINNISIYGSCINVELDKYYNLVSINSSKAPNINVSTTAKISPEEARKNASAFIKNEIPESSIPLLYLYFFDNNWRLVYMVKNVLSKRERINNDAVNETNLKLHKHGFPNYVDIIIDAESGDVLKEKPKVMSAGSNIYNDFDDYITPKEVPLSLINEEYNVYTHDLNFLRYDLEGSLPGSIITKSDADWLPAGVYAHYNACIVSKFLKEVLRRNGIDNNGMKLISTVQCVEEDGKEEWENAAWLSSSNQMVYGQIKSGDSLKSLAASLDIVAHEVLHGVTSFTCGLDYENQSGALDESYSDIFGILISNYTKNDRSTWNWQLGEDTTGVPLRDIANPPLYNQPDHMDGYQNLPNNEWFDYGGVHLNSGIHNKAAYNLITSKSDAGEFVFEIEEAAILFYLSLIQLSNSSGFNDSYRSIVNSAYSLFKNDVIKGEKIEAIKRAFNEVGIH